MIYQTQLLPGITLRCFSGEKFKQSSISVQLVRPMCRQEASLNALLPAVMLRGSEKHPDLRSIALRLDDLYGAEMSALVRRVGDYQTTGLTCSFLEDQYTREGILTQMVELLGELLLTPQITPAATESEKQNLLDAIDARKNDKRVYAADQLMRLLCREDSFGIPRLGERDTVPAITAEMLRAHRERIFRESRIDCFYVGSQPPEKVASLLREMFSPVLRDYRPLPPQTPLGTDAVEDTVRQMDVAQGKLCMGFTTPITLRDPEYPAMLLLNAILGGGMNSKLFMQVRKKQSLCYDIGSGYYGSKGIVIVSAGTDFRQTQSVRQQVLALLADCCQGNITQGELESARQTLLSGLRSIHDSPSAIEGYYASGALSGFSLTPEQYRQALQAVTLPQICAAARTLELKAVYILTGVTPC